MFVAKLAVVIGILFVFGIIGYAIVKASNGNNSKEEQNNKKQTKRK